MRPDPHPAPDRRGSSAGWRRWTDGRAIALALVWIPAVLWCDRSVGLAGQLALGAVTWTLLLWWLAHETPTVRMQTVVVVVLATVVELVFSGWLGVYVYRLDHVPMYVPPGHGLVYLAALAIGRTALLRRHARLAVRATVVVAGLWAAWGVVVSDRTDLLGLFWYLCLVGFLLWGRSTLLYVGAFLVVSYLELVGTRWGVWQWQPHDTIVGWVPIGNPPSIAAGGYGWFDLWALLLAPGLLRGWYRLRGRAPSAQEASSASTASCSSPFVESPLPRSGPSMPSSPVNRPPASVTTRDTPATS